MIVKLAAPDFERWKELRLEAVSAHPESFGESYQDVQAQDLAWFNLSLRSGTTFAYEKNAQLIGLVGTFSMQPGNMRHRATLFGMYVKPAYRKAGVGDALVDHVIDFVKPDHKQIHLTVTTSNHAAIALYKKHDFEIYGTEPDALCVNGGYYDVHLMLRRL